MLSSWNVRASITWARFQIMNKRFGKKDIIFLVIVAVLCICALLGYRFFLNDSGSFAEVMVDGNIYGVYPLGKDKTVEIRDKNGKTTNILRIEDGQADMIEADCPDKICVEHIPVNKNRQTIVCLPNKVVVTIKGNDEVEVDSIAK